VAASLGSNLLRPPLVVENQLEISDVILPILLDSVFCPFILFPWAPPCYVSTYSVLGPNHRIPASFGSLMGEYDRYSRICRPTVIINFYSFQTSCWLTKGKDSFRWPRNLPTHP